MQYISANPALSVSEAYVCLYSRDSTTLTVTERTAEVGRITVSGGILDAAQNDAGMIVIVHNDDRYRSVVSVYNRSLAGPTLPAAGLALTGLWYDEFTLKA